jgi:hypothetical protein
MVNQLFTKYYGGGEEPPKKSLSYDQINQWSDYVEKNPSVKSFDKLWMGFNKLNPKSGIDPDILLKDIDLLRAYTRQQAQRNNSEFVADANTGYSFPKMTYNGKDYGRVNAKMQTQVPIPTPETSYPENMVAKQLPDGVNDMWFDESKGLVAFVHPQTGDITYADKTVLASPKAKMISKASGLGTIGIAKNK